MILYRVEDSDTGTPVYNRHQTCWYLRKSSAENALRQFQGMIRPKRQRYCTLADPNKLVVKTYELTEVKNG